MCINVVKKVKKVKKLKKKQYMNTQKYIKT